MSVRLRLRNPALNERGWGFCRRGGCVFLEGLWNYVTMNADVCDNEWQINVCDVCVCMYFHSAAYAPKLHSERINLLDISTLSVQVFSWYSLLDVEASRTSIKSWAWEMLCLAFCQGSRVYERLKLQRRLSLFFLLPSFMQNNYFEIYPC